MSRTQVQAMPSLQRHRRLAARPLLRRLMAALVAWQENAKARYELERLDERTLRDVGLTRIQISRALSGPWLRR